MSFVLDPRLAADGIDLGRLDLCRVVLVDERRCPWVILVPERDGVREIHELDDADQVALVRASSRLARTMTALFAPDKLNIAALGNVVPQLHVHHVARYRSDPMWPKPVWGMEREAYAPGDADRVAHALRDALGIDRPPR